ncbi:SemiSWEET family sugar transporter [Candidatus Lokiarchaeum ossiferum]|uniref:SemiSWEET family sugar transporter n=1 Tax=Candidatus Lokiarchaeum ossiferum TaxID=2951803 RepID=UPI00352E9C95
MAFWYELVGSVAAILTTISFIPQAWKVYRTRKTDDISLSMWILFTTGVTFWMIYGFFLQDWNIVGANGVTALLAGYILVKKIQYLIRPTLRQEI